MDESALHSLLDGLAAALGLEGVTLLAALSVLSIVCRLIGKSIPDSETGALGLIRKICKLLGLYVSNRLTPTVTTNDAARAAARIPPK